MSSAQSPPSTTASPTTTRDSSSQAGLPDKTLLKIHGAAGKQAGLPREPLPVGRPNVPTATSNLDEASSEQLEARQRQRRYQDSLLTTEAPRRHLLNKIVPAGKWGECHAKLSGLLGTGFLVVLVGSRWTGKTQMATELIRAVVRESCDEDCTPNAHFATMMQFFMAIKEAYKADGPTESAQVELFAGYSLLVLDEAHERSDSEWEQRLLNEMLNRRYNAMKDTLLLTNMKSEAFSESIGPTIQRRIAETGLEIVCDWPSFRTRSPV